MRSAGAHASNGQITHLSEPVAYPEVHDNVHGLRGDDTLADVRRAVRPCSGERKVNTEWLYA